MRQTLFYIPHEVFGLPVFGMGWALIVWAVASVALLWWLVRRQGWNADTRSYLPLLLLVAVAFCFGLPFLEERSAAGAPLGLAIRGYGVMLLVAVICGVGLAVQQARRMGLDPELIYSLALWSFVGGIIGARAFYVIQYWPQFDRPTLGATFRALLNVTQGGLVVYGSLIGAGITGIWFIRKHGLPLLAVVDLVAPSMALGMAIGRIGCLLNGCCHGGLCENPTLGITFPRGSPPYVHDSPPYIHQHSLGQLHGFTIGRDPDSAAAVVKAVEPKGAAEKGGLVVGAVIKSINGESVDSYETARKILATSGPALAIETDVGTARVVLPRLPPRSKPVHPTQIYSAISAAVLCLLLWAYYPFRRRDGEVMALLLTLYPITRFLLEIIRNDEPGRFGTSLTVSQIISLAIFAAACVLWRHLSRQPRGSVLPAVEGDMATAIG
ncbi:MAG: prolipoprotein diacylglyceryl transferase [Pirellulaceae bacterium]|nr:prolipoprotein diacylglyceryl transferase [Pirellulaceae bacterium]